MVRFSRMDEFLEELRRDAALVDRRIVRVTVAATPSKLHPIEYFSVVATARVGEDKQLVRFERFVGDDLGRDEGADVRKRAHALREELAAELARAPESFDVRAGVFEADA